MIPAQIGPYSLRLVSAWDAEGLFKITSDPKLMRFMSVKTHTDIHQTHDLIRAYIGSSARFLSVLRDDEFLGIVGVEVQGHQAAITIKFRSDIRAARGTGRTVGGAVISWLLKEAGMQRVWAFCHVDNIAAQRVMERFLMSREGRLRRFHVFPNISEEPEDVYVYSMVRDDYKI